MSESFNDYFKQYEVNPDAEIAKLGDNGKEQVEVLDNWAKANLSEATYNSLTSSLVTADGLKAMMEIREKFMEGNTSIPNDNSGSTQNPETVSDLQNEMVTKYDQYHNDANYRNEWQNRLAAAVEREKPKQG